MQDNNIKIQSEYFEAVLRGEKRAEWRKNDRDYKEGDIYTLNEVGADRRLTGRSVQIRITHVVYGGKFEMPKDYCMFSFVRTDEDERCAVLERALQQSRNALSLARNELQEKGVAIVALAKMIAGGAR